MPVFASFLSTKSFKIHRAYISKVQIISSMFCILSLIGSIWSVYSFTVNKPYETVIKKQMAARAVKGVEKLQILSKVEGHVK